MEAGPWIRKIALDRIAPIVCYQHNIHPDLKRLTEVDKKSFVFVANSPFTRDALRILGIESTVVPPLFSLDRYDRAEPENRRYATFVCLKQKKGVEIALLLAKHRPNREFLFVPSWGTEPEVLAKCEAMENVRLFPTKPDLRDAFRQTRLLLMPSLRTETWGLCASEAQVAGIPVLASNGGNLPDTVGAGGAIVHLALDFEYWLRSFDKFYDPHYYHSLAAMAASRGGELLGAVEQHVDTFVEVLSGARA
jgi:glycosyltransferase involved in cell wall biosynthesis